ncbi:hypothetical protein H6G74_01790 [Nostoc spongiaeforme FACHB-130]|uniref:Uncharacterized protein n=1 Tax=Nostoc spongiaeforme FACHB-130 TaxID=1357510 RepID=A0ABR8FP17_9NOSO|nr:hypothetical protein [Nostoc spongiaeforme FACHB-130]
MWASLNFIGQNISNHQGAEVAVKRTKFTLQQAQRSPARVPKPGFYV